MLDRRFQLNSLFQHCEIVLVSLICKLGSRVLIPFNLTTREKSKAERVILSERSYCCETSQTWYQVSHLFFLIVNTAATLMQEPSNKAQIRSAKCNMESVLPGEKHHRVTLFLC